MKNLLMSKIEEKLKDWERAQTKVSLRYSQGSVKLYLIGTVRCAKRCRSFELRTEDRPPHRFESGALLNFNIISMGPSVDSSDETVIKLKKRQKNKLQMEIWLASLPTPLTIAEKIAVSRAAKHLA
jgi:hypothetical protein